MSRTVRTPPPPSPAPDPSQIDFLPDWYPRLRRRKHLLAAAACLLAALAGGMTLWGTTLRREVAAAQATLDEASRRRGERRREDEVVTKLGRHVEASRVLATLDRVMPPGAALTQLSLETEPGLQDVFSLSNLNGWRQRGLPGNGDQRLRAQLRAVAPSAVDGANLVAGLSKIPFLRDVEMVDARDRLNPLAARGAAGGGAVETVNEFRVTFWIDLNPPPSESASRLPGAAAAGAVAASAPAGAE